MNNYTTGYLQLLFLLITIYSTIIINADIYPPTWQQYYPSHHAWAGTSQQFNNMPRRMRLGRGKFRILPTGNVEINCDFPDTMLMISNIIWERADMGTQDLSSLYRRHGITHQYDVHMRPQGSTLHLFDVTPLDRGLYRCIATALDSTTNQVVTLFQDTEFFAEFS